MWLILSGSNQNHHCEHAVGYTKTKKQAQKYCRDQGYKGSDTLFFGDSELYYMEIEKMEELYVLGCD